VENYRELGVAEILFKNKTKHITTN